MDYDIKGRLTELRKRKQIAIDKFEAFKNQTWIKIIQEKGQEKRLQRIEKMQKRTFEKLIKNKHPELLDEWQDLFAEFFIDFLAEKCKSINDFLYRNRLANEELRELKRRFRAENER